MNAQGILSERPTATNKEETGMPGLWIRYFQILGQYLV